MTSGYQRPNPKAFQMPAKACGHYVNSVMASQQAKAKGYDEALLLDMHGHIAEAPGANFFLEKDGKLITPAEGHILPGITRATVFEICQLLDIQVEQRTIAPEEIAVAQSAFFCGTAAEIIGIAAIDEIVFPASWSNTLGARIQKAYKSLVTEESIFELEPSA
jgi:branched-chain amino acid aminotransferase